MALKKTIKDFLYNLPPSLKGILRYLILIKLFVQNFLASTKKEQVTDWVCAMEGYDPKERSRYSEEVFYDYFRYSGFTADFLKGKRILEIGPGENLGVALQCLAYGAEKVVCIDR